MEDESSEATIPEPFVIGEEAGETQVRQVAAATPEISLRPLQSLLLQWWTYPHLNVQQTLPLLF